VEETISQFREIGKSVTEQIRIIITYLSLSLKGDARSNMASVTLFPPGNFTSKA